MEFAQGLIELDWEILSSGGTAKHLAAAGVPVRDVAELVGPAILGHKVVTLSREIHAMLLADDSEVETAELAKLGLSRIDLVCVDLYPLEEEIANPEATPESVVQKTDIGGPTILRSAAKGRRIVVCNQPDREAVLEWLKEGEELREVVITGLVANAERLVSDYVDASAKYHEARHVKMLQDTYCC